MDIRFLTTFLEVAETRHFGRAAESLYLTQSAVSARIKQLEEYFNTPLFIRNRNSIQITPAGEKLIPFARAIAKEIAQARQALAEEEFTHVAIASTQATMPLFLNSFLPTLIDNFNNISFKHEVNSIEQITRQLHEHSIDFGLTTSPVKSDDVESTLLLKVHLSLYTSDTFEQTNAEHYDFIQVDFSPSVSEQVLAQYPELKKAKVKTTSIEIALDLFSQSKFKAVLPSLTNKYIDKKLLQSLVQQSNQLLPENFHVPIYINKMKNNPNKGIEAIISYTTDACDLALTQHLNL